MFRIPLFSFLVLIIFSPSVFSEQNAPVVITIVALGDSTTAGTPGFRSPAEIPPNGQGNPESQYAYWLMKTHPEWNILNRGVNGERADEISLRFNRDVLAYHPEAVVVLAGVNDLYQGNSIDQIKSRLTDIYDKAVQNHIPVLACTILPFDRAAESVRVKMKLMNRWIKKNARKRGFGYCDTYQAVEDPHRSGNLLSTPDGYHPDAEGYRRMADAIAPALEKILQKKRPI